MARITVEDCLENVDNLFELVLVASRRARRLANGAEATLPWENDKPTVMALREIAEGMVGREILDESKQMFDEQPAPVAGEGDPREAVPELTIPQTIPADD